MRTEFEDAQHALRYAAVNKLYPGLITVHLVNVPLKSEIGITAYLEIDSEIMRLDAALKYGAINGDEELLDAVLNIIDLRVQEYKEKNK